VARAQSVWTGTASTNWFTGANWNTGTVPDATTPVDINTATPDVTVINGNTANSAAIQIAGAPNATGDLLIENAGVLDSALGAIGYAPGSNGKVAVTGNSSTWTLSDQLLIGSSGTGALHVMHGAEVHAEGLAALGSAGGTGELDVDGAGSKFIVDNGQLNLGGDGTSAGSGSGTVSFTDGALGGMSGLVLGVSPKGNGTATVDGAGTEISSSQDILVGASGTGTLTVQNGARVEVDTNLDIGELADSHGTVVDTGAGTDFILFGNVTVGDGGTGSLSVLDGAILTDGQGSIGNSDKTISTALVSGAGSSWSNSASFYVGAFGDGKLTVSKGGTVNDVDFYVSGITGVTGTVLVTDLNSSIASTNSLNIGYAGTGNLEVANGGSATADTAGLGVTAGSFGEASVHGAGSAINATTSLGIGEDGTGKLTIFDKGLVSDVSAALGFDTGSKGTVIVDGPGSLWFNTSFLIVGYNGSGDLTVQNGGAVRDSQGMIAIQPGSSSTVTVTGAGSAWTNGQLEVGGNDIPLPGGGDGTLTIQDDGLVSAAALSIAHDVNSKGTINIGGAPGDAPTGAGMLDVPTITFGAGAGRINFNHTSQDYVFTPALSGQGRLNQIAGITHLVADSSGFSGQSNVTGGTLYIDGMLGAGAINVSAGAALGGSGETGGIVTVADGGRLLGVQGQTLTMGGLSLSSGATIDVTLDSPGGAALFQAGNLVLDGTVNISAPGAFGPGVYSLFLYGGSLVDNGLDIGTTPTGTSASDFTIQTIIPGQVNLADVKPLDRVFWDGDGTGSANNNAVDGGSGVWSVTNTNWTDVSGASNGAMTPQPGFAIFQNIGGAVTVDDSAGPVAITGMQFDVNGYSVAGDTITLADPNTIIRVGDGTTAGGNFVATIGSPLSGSGGLDKTDLGRLILTGTNSYAGGTTISSGTLQIGDGSPGAFASVAGNIVDNSILAFDNQALQNTANDISGTGLVLVKGTTVLAGTNTYTGGTAIGSTSTLFIGAGGTTGSIVGDVADDGLLEFSRSNVVTFGGIVSGSGNVAQNGTGALRLTGINTYTGVTGVLSGALVLSGNGSIATSSSVFVSQPGTLDISATSAGASITTISGAGNVVLGAQTLTLTAANDSFGGVISGAGQLQILDGTEKLTGANTYTGGTVIGANGALVLLDTGSITGDIKDDRALVFDRTADLSFNGTISGAGGIVQEGTGVITLTGVNTYSAGTDIAQGTLVGSATSFGTGAIEDDGALVIDQPVDAVFANALGGGGSFEKRSAGSLNYTGDGSSVTGTTLVSAGRLAVNGSLAGSVVTVASGATLGGNGTVGGVVAQGGSIVAPGNSIGDLHVAGNYAQASGSTYQVQLTSTGMADRIDVTGSAVIASGAVLNVETLDTAPYQLGMHYTLLDATGGVSGTFALTGNTQISNFLGLVLAYAPQDVYLDVAQTKTFASAGATPNQMATGGGLDSLPATNPIVGAVVVMPDDATAQAAFDQLSGEIHASVKTAMLEDGRLVRDAAIGRLLAVQGRGTGLWGIYTGSWAKNDGNGNPATITRNASNFVLGVDTSPASGLTVGVLGGYDKSDVRLPARNSTAKINSYTAGFYAGAAAGPVKLRFGGAYSWQSLETNRSVVFAGFSDKLNAKYKASTAQAFGDVGYTIGTERLNLEPFAQVAWMDVATNAFTETGGAAALKASKQSQDLGVVTLGLRGVAGFSIAGASARFHATAGWRQATGGRTPDASLSFASGGATFDIAGAPIAKTSAMIDTGLDVAITPMLRLNVGYVGQLASRTRDNGVRAGLSMAF
jgi:outer membrane autotransporter protein